MRDIVVIDSKSTKVRVALTAVIIFALVFGWFSIRWQFGNMLASLTEPDSPNASQLAGLSAKLAPADPLAHSLKALTNENPTAAIEFLKQAVRLAPVDYRRRIELGKAYEQDGQVKQAEIEFKRAAELAPSYASIRWHLGNFYLRQERNEDAIAELKKAAENDRTYRDQVFSLAWDLFNKDALLVESMIGENPDVRAHLAYFFAARGRAEDSLRNWNKLSESQKADNMVIAKSIALGLFDQRHFAQALEFSKQHGAETGAKAETVTNGSFEKNIGVSDDTRFGWLIVRNESKLDITTDGKVKRGGERSLRMAFNGYSKPALANVFQTVIVEPNKNYSLRFWVRTENLRSAGMPMIEIINANDEMTIGRSDTFPTGINDWQEAVVEFSTPNNCSGISIRTIRSFCGENCPISGTFWYDDFELERR